MIDTMRNVVTQKMVGIVLATVFCVGSAAAYVEFRSSENANKVRTEFTQALTNKYNYESGLRLEILVDQQGKSIEAALENQSDLIKVVDKINTTLEVLNAELRNLKERTKQ